MDNSKATLPINVAKKHLTNVFNALPEEIAVANRKVQYYARLVLEAMVKEEMYSSNPLCSKKGVAAFVAAVKFYNIGLSAFSESMHTRYLSELDLNEEEIAQIESASMEALENALKEAELEFSDDLSFYNILRDIIKAQYERWNGEGLPSGLCAAQVPLAAQIASACHRFNYLTTSNDIHDKLTLEAALEELKKLSGEYYDEKIIKAFEIVLSDIANAMDSGELFKIAGGKKGNRAIEQFYRMVYDYSNRLTYGYETKLRLNDKVMGNIESDVFIPVAEKSSKINELIKWSVEEACEAVSKLHIKGRFTGIIFIDMSVKALLKKNFIENMARIIKSYDLENNEFCFVIPENMLSLNINGVVEAAKKLHELGFLVAIKGFGTEYSNLVAFKDLNVDYIMLEKEFVSEILISIRAKKIAESIIELSNRLDTMVIADGVATKDQADALFAMGCALMRGTRFGRFTDASGI